MWLPARVIAQAAVRFLPATDGPPEPAMWAATALMAVSSLVVVAPSKPQYRSLCVTVGSVHCCQAALHEVSAGQTLTAVRSFVSGKNLALGPVKQQRMLQLETAEIISIPNLAVFPSSCTS